MTFRNMLRAAMLGLMAVGVHAVPVSAETLRIAEGRTQSALRVPLNRAIVLESDVPFAELSVANPLIADIATLSERTVYVLGKAPGRTTLTLLGPDGRLITNVEVQVTPDVAEFKERLKDLMPGEHIEVRTANDGIILSGTVSSGQKVDQAIEVAERYAPGAVLNLMTVGGTQQVMLKVKFAEMQRSVTKALGSEFSVNGTAFDDDLGINASANNGATSPAGTVALNFGTDSLNFNILLEALETKGLVRTLSEPNLSALSGQEASFLAGGEVPIPVQDDEGNVSVDYRPFGVELGFTPTVVDGDVINLQLNTSVSSIDTSSVTNINGALVNGFSQRQASTTVELRDGQAFAIAGLLQDEFRDGATQVPWLGDVPVLGGLFRSANYTRDQSELVIIISAHLVNPTAPEALALPTDRIRPPTENELFLYGRLSAGAQPGTAASTKSGVAGQDFSGNYGYVME